MVQLVKHGGRRHRESSAGLSLLKRSSLPRQQQPAVPRAGRTLRGTKLRAVIIVNLLSQDRGGQANQTSGNHKRETDGDLRQLDNGTTGMTSQKPLSHSGAVQNQKPVSNCIGHDGVRAGRLGKSWFVNVWPVTAFDRDVDEKYKSNADPFLSAAPIEPHEPL